MAGQSSAKVGNALNLRTDVTSHLKKAMLASEVKGVRGVSLRSIPFVNQIGIRTVLGSDSAKSLEAALKVKLPTRVGNVTSGSGTHGLWLSPDEFLLVTDPASTESKSAREQVEALAQALGEQPGSVIDLSSNRVFLELAGPSAQAVLEKGCAYDLHPHLFTPGTAVQTAIGKVPVIVWKHSEQNFYVLPRSSFADYLINWLMDAMKEFAAAEVK